MKRGAERRARTRFLARWARRFHVSARSAFSLLRATGEDCPGGVQFAAPDRVDRLLGGRDPEVDWLTEEQVGARLRALNEDGSAWRLPGDAGRFSLAGAQAKDGSVPGRRAMGSASRPDAHDAHSETSDSRLSRTLRKRASLPDARPRARSRGGSLAGTPVRRREGAHRGTVRPRGDCRWPRASPPGRSLPGPRSAADGEVRERRRPRVRSHGRGDPDALQPTRARPPNVRPCARAELGHRRDRRACEELLRADRRRRTWGSPPWRCTHCAKPLPPTWPSGCMKLLRPPAPKVSTTRSLTGWKRGSARAPWRARRPCGRDRGQPEGGVYLPSMAVQPPSANRTVPVT